MSDDAWGDSGDDWDDSNLNLNLNLNDAPLDNDFDDAPEAEVAAPQKEKAQPKKASNTNKPKHIKKKKQEERDAKIAAFEARRQALFDDLGGDPDEEIDGDEAARRGDAAIAMDMFGDIGEGSAGPAVKQQVAGLKQARGDSLKEILKKMTLKTDEENLVFAKQFADKLNECADPIVIVGAIKEVLRVIKPHLTSKDYGDLSSFATMQKNKKKKEESAGVKSKKKKKKGPVAKTLSNNDWMDGGGYNEYDDYADDFM